MKPRYKLVCWKGISIPVDERRNWMAFDRDGSVCVFDNRPATTPFKRWGANGGDFSVLDVPKATPRPESGAWDRQLYWIG